MKKNNQYLNSDVFFTSAPGLKTTILERRANRLCLYTEDNNTWRCFRKWKQCIYQVPYHQGDITGPLIAVDLYFPMTAKKQLLRALLNNRKATPVS